MYFVYGGSERGVRAYGADLEAAQADAARTGGTVGVDSDEDCEPRMADDPVVAPPCEPSAGDLQERHYAGDYY